MAFLDSKVEITEKQIKEALESPRDFGYSGDNDELFSTWSLGPVFLTRDSDLLEQSNADALIKHLESDETLADDWAVEHCGHWGVGWVDHLSFRVLDADGKPSRIFRVLTAWFDALADYPLADEDDYSQREYEATIENIRNVGRSMLCETPPDAWEYLAFEWFGHNDQSAIEPRDGGGGYPSDKEMKACLIALGIASDELYTHAARGAFVSPNPDPTAALCGSSEGEIDESYDARDVDCPKCRKQAGLD